MACPAFAQNGLAWASLRSPTATSALKNPNTWPVPARANLQERSAAGGGQGLSLPDGGTREGECPMPRPLRTIHLQTLPVVEQSPAFTPMLQQAPEHDGRSAARLPD